MFLHVIHCCGLLELEMLVLKKWWSSRPLVIVLCVKRCEELVCLSALSQRCHQSAVIIELLSPKTRGSCHGGVLTVFRHLKGKLEFISCLRNGHNNF